MNLYIYPYASGSESAKLLADRLGALRIKLSNSTYQYKEGDLIINWGNSNCPYPCLNEGTKLRETVNKLRLFRLVNREGLGHLLPQYWTDPDDIPQSAFPVFCRQRLEGCDGDGIVIANKRSELVPAKLYTKYVGSGTEYRVTYFKGVGVTDIQTKLPRTGEEAHTFIKTYANGWGFQRKPVESYIANSLESVAKALIDATGLDFFGLDVIKVGSNLYVLEVNSAMGLEGDALERFAQAIEAHVESITPKLTPAGVTYPVPGVGRTEIEDSLFELDFELAYQDKRWADVIKLAASRL